MLSLLSEVAEEQPLVCVVDDAQWLDRASAQVLAFVARRLLAEPVALVFAVREPAASDELAGLPELVDPRARRDGDARALLDSVITGPLDERVRDRIVAETRGNPLALLELPRGLTPAELAGGFGLPDAPAAGRPASRRASGGASSRCRPETQRLLLVAAAEPVGDPVLVWRAAAAARASASTPRRRRPTPGWSSSARGCGSAIRWCARRSTARPRRRTGRRVHGALAEATDPERRSRPPRLAPRARDAPGPTRTVAAELERSAGRAQARGGLAAAAAFLERAAELTPDPARRGARALAAAQAKYQAGAPDAALRAARRGRGRAARRARSARGPSLLRAQIAFARRAGSDAPPLLLEAARRLEPLDAALARETYLDAFAAALFAGRLAAAAALREVAEAVRAAAWGAVAASPRAVDLLLDGLAVLVHRGLRRGRADAASRRSRAFRDEDDLRARTRLRWLWLACRVARDAVATTTSWHELDRPPGRAGPRDRRARRAARSRSTSALGVQRRRRRARRGDGAARGGRGGHEATGSARRPHGALLLAAWRGQRGARRWR